MKNNDATQLSARITSETKKLQEINAGILKIKDQLEADRKLFCTEFRKSFTSYSKETTVHKKKFK